VLKKSGVNLELEIKLIGFPENIYEDIYA